jgi:hypothetical protein
MFRLLKSLVLIVFISTSTSQYLFSGCSLVRCENSIFFREPHWKIDPSDFEFAMTMVAKIENGRDNVADTMFEIGAFVGNELRGTTESFYIPDLGVNLFFLTIFGNVQGEKLSFRLYDRSLDMEIALNENLDFYSNTHFGSIISPFHFTQFNTNIEENVVNSKMAIFPNPVQSTLQIDHDTKFSGNMYFVIINEQGRVCNVFNKIHLSEGQRTKLKVDHLVPGKYFIVFYRPEGQIYHSKPFLKVNN